MTERNPANKHHVLVDEEAAPMVKKIFQLPVSGKGPGRIAGILRDGKIVRPSSYYNRKESETSQNSDENDRPYVHLQPAQHAR